MVIFIYYIIYFSNHNIFLYDILLVILSLLYLNLEIMLLNHFYLLLFIHVHYIVLHIIYFNNLMAIKLLMLNFIVIYYDLYLYYLCFYLFANIDDYYYYDYLYGFHHLCICYLLFDSLYYL